MDDYRLELLKKLINEKYEGKKGKFCEISGINNSHLSRILGKERGLTWNKIKEIEKKCNVPNWFRGSHEELDPEYITIENAFLSDSPIEGDVDLSVRNLTAFRMWIVSKLGTKSPDHIKFIHNFGDNMHPTIHEEDIAFIDVSARSIDKNGIYAFIVNNRLLLRRVTMLTSGHFVLSSDNNEYNDKETLTEKEMMSLAVYGKYLKSLRLF